MVSQALLIPSPIASNASCAFPRMSPSHEPMPESPMIFPNNSPSFLVMKSHALRMPSPMDSNILPAVSRIIGPPSTINQPRRLLMSSRADARSCGAFSSKPCATANVKSRPHCKSIVNVSGLVSSSMMTLTHSIMAEMISLMFCVNPRASSTISWTPTEIIIGKILGKS